MTLTRAALILSTPFLLAGCMSDGVRPMAGFAPPPVAPVTVAAAPETTAPHLPGSSKGAILQVSQGYAALHQGLRARRVGDILSIVLVENITSTKSTSSQTGRSGSASLIPPIAGPLSFLNPNALNASGDSSFNGSGNAAQRSTLNGTISVSIAEVRQGGTARVVGEKHMALSQGKEFVQFSGLIRLADVDSDNRVMSSQVADAQILYSGKGTIQRASKPGWLSEFFAKISPF